MGIMWGADACMGLPRHWVWIGCECCFLMTGNEVREKGGWSVV
jgi:hypothetical protein